MFWVTILSGSAARFKIAIEHGKIFVEDERVKIAAFDRAEEMMRSYPNNESLMLNVTLSLDGMLQLSDLSDSERTGLFSKTEAWYRHLSESGESMTRNVANYMLVYRYIDRGNLEQAQDVLDSMPDRNTVIEDYADKLMLQVKIYQCGCSWS